MSRKIYSAFLFILIFSPLAFGTVEQWSVTIMECSSFAALLLLLISELRSKEPVLYETPGIVPLFCLMAYHIVQIIPLPPSFVRLVSPDTYNLYATTIGLTGQLDWLSLSINKKATLQEFFRLSSYIAFYILTIQLLSRKELLKKTVMIVIVFSALLALFSILQYLFYNQKIYWLRTVTNASPFGPFVNRNHYAGFMGMIAPIAVSIFFAYKPRVTYASLRQKVVESLNHRDTNKYILLGLASILIAASIFLSLSRGGIISLIISMIILGFMIVRRRVDSRVKTFIFTVVILIVLAVGWFGWGPIFSRFEEIKGVSGAMTDTRVTYWKDSVGIIRDFFLTGTGFGSFSSIYPKYRTLLEAGFVDHAHNDYIELVTDGGVIAFALTSWYLFQLLYKAHNCFLNRNENYSIYLYIGCLTGIIGILIHSLTDFNLHIGSNGLYFFFIAGLLVAAANTRLRGTLPSYLRMKSAQVRTGIVLTSIFLLSSLFFDVGVILGEVQFSLTKQVSLTKNSDARQLIAVKEGINKASVFDPLESRYQYEIGNIETLLSNPAAARSQFVKSLKLEPANGEYLQRAGLSYDDMNEKDTAEKLIREGIFCDRVNSDRYRAYAYWLFEQGRKEDALNNIKTVISLYPDSAAEYIKLMVLNEIGDDEMLGMMPQRVLSYLAFGDYLNSTGKDEKAENAYLSAIDFIKKEQVISPTYFYRVESYYIKKGSFEQALNIMQQAKTYFPRNADVYNATGSLYEQLGMINGAIVEYKNVLLFQPKNIEVLKKIEKLSSGTL